jgi:hypothetical protein
MKISTSIFIAQKNRHFCRLMKVLYYPIGLAKLKNKRAASPRKASA